MKTLQPENGLNWPAHNSRLFRPRMEREGMGGQFGEAGIFTFHSEEFGSLFRTGVRKVPAGE
jgi:hypothetical protein